MNELKENGNKDKLLQKLLEGYENQATRAEALRKADEFGVFPDLMNMIEKAAETKRTPGEIILRPLTEYEEKPAEFLVPNRIPKGQITILGGEGGTGKSFIVADTIAGITSGNKCLLSEEVPFEIPEERRTVIIFNAEDDIEHVMKARLREAGAVESKILTLSLADKNFSEIKFDSQKIEGIIQRYKPALMIFDPLQAFIPPETNMGARNAMRACLNPLIGLGEKYEVSFIIVMHVNKQAGVWGRKRLADSSDMWDIARSVLMVGQTVDGNRYISHEKNNYGEQCQTILFNIEDGRVSFLGTSSKKDHDFVSEYYQEMKSAPAKDLAEQMILSYLMEHHDEKVEIGDMDAAMMDAGIKKSTLRRAKENLKQTGKIVIKAAGFGAERKWLISITQNKMDK